MKCIRYLIVEPAISLPMLPGIALLIIPYCITIIVIALTEGISTTVIVCCTVLQSGC